MFFIFQQSNQTFTNFMQDITDYLIDSMNWGVDVSLKVLSFMTVMYLVVFLFKK